MNDSPVLLEARRVGRQNAGVWLLQDIDLCVRAGERLALVGPSGAGKTLLLRALALLDPLDQGIILWKSQPIHAAAVPDFRRQATYLHQRPALFEGTVEENLRLPFSLQAHKSGRFDKEKVVRLLAETGRNESFLRKNQRDLSGGESQIFAMIRALQLSPSVLFLDEPTSALDPPTTAAIENLLLLWQRDGDGSRAFIWVSHDAEQVQRVAQHSIYLRQGRLEGR